MKRILLLLAVMAMLVFAFAPAAQAQQETIFINERIPYTSTGPNPCTGEVVFIEGTQHIVFRAAYDGSGGLTP